jgi:hypothetical protein
LIELRFKECPENIIEMIESKLDENNHEESEIKELWKENEIQIKDKHGLKDKLNKIISKLNERDSKYYDYYDLNEYNLIL